MLSLALLAFFHFYGGCQHTAPPKDCQRFSVNTRIKMNSFKFKKKYAISDFLGTVANAAFDISSHFELILWTWSFLFTHSAVTSYQCLSLAAPDRNIQLLFCRLLHCVYYKWLLSHWLCQKIPASRPYSYAAVSSLRISSLIQPLSKRPVPLL